MPTHYFGRGASNCIALRPIPGFRFEIFVGNGKNIEEKGPSFIGNNCDLSQLADFFRAMLEMYGYELYTGRLVDDPHDEVLYHTLDLNTVEE